MPEAMVNKCPSLMSAFLGSLSGKRFRQILFGEDLGFQPVGNLVVLFLQHDAAGDAGVCLADGSHGRGGFAISFAVILFVDQETVPDH